MPVPARARLERRRRAGSTRVRSYSVPEDEAVMISLKSTLNEVGRLRENLIVHKLLVHEVPRKLECVFRLLEGPEFLAMECTTITFERWHFHTMELGLPCGAMALKTTFECNTGATKEMNTHPNYGKAATPQLHQVALVLIPAELSDQASGLILSLKQLGFCSFEAIATHSPESNAVRLALNAVLLGLIQSCVQTLQLPELEATVPHPSTSPLPSAKAIKTHSSDVVSSWVPHPFTQQESEAVRLECLGFLAMVREIEKVQTDIYPVALPAEVVAQLLFARQSYVLRYFRLFRVNDLPTEIISNILRLVVWDSMKRPVDARLRVTWTCRRWREIALSDATLWNAIWFRGSGARIDRAWAWFERARQSPLDVRIDGDPSTDADDEAEIDSDLPLITAAAMGEMLVRLLTKLPTIRMLIVVVEDWESALTVLDLLTAKGPSGVPVLKRFELHRGGLRTEDRKTLAWPGIMSQPFLGGAVAPSLEYLSLNGVPIDWSKSVLRNLVTLDIRRLPALYSPDASRFREILNNCPRLNKLTMDGAGPVFEERSLQDIVPVHLPYLRTLVVADFSWPYLMFLFSQFSAPDVNDLTLMNLCGDDYLPVFIKITSAFPKVRLLTAYSIQFNVSPAGLSAMTGWLDSMPLLTYLRVANVANQFFGIFFRSHAVRTPVAPRLATVDCQSIEPAILVQWAKDRAEFGTPLQKIYISEELGARLENAQVLMLTTLCMLAQLPRGATTPEEEELSLTL
ncbi:hypothetical protein DFH06DRAFT_1291500 [Mycena polygramma]|nr:hypothetical protein DFH06DRAFT_1291500 [Mycena polygramma]